MDDYRVLETSEIALRYGHDQAKPYALLHRTANVEYCVKRYASFAKAVAALIKLRGYDDGGETLLRG